MYVGECNAGSWRAAAAEQGRLAKRSRENHRKERKGDRISSRVPEGDKEENRSEEDGRVTRPRGRRRAEDANASACTGGNRRTRSPSRRENKRKGEIQVRTQES